MQFANSQIASRITLEDGTIQTKCDQCRILWQERNERGIAGDPPCDTCRVELMDENKEVVDVYMLTKTQYITAEEGQPIDINLLAVIGVMDLYNVVDRKKCLSRVRMLFHHFEKEKRDNR